MARWRKLTAALVVAALPGIPGCMAWDEFLAGLDPGSQGPDNRPPAERLDGGVAQRDGGAATDAGASSSADAGARPDPRASYAPADEVAFVDFFKPMLEMEIEALDRVATRGADAQLRAAAAAMRDHHRTEYDRLRDRREALTGEGRPPDIADPWSDAVRARLGSLEGAALDVAFLVHSIAHHGGAIDPARRATFLLPPGDLRTLAFHLERESAEAVANFYGHLQRISGDARGAVAREVAEMPATAVRRTDDPRQPFTPTDDASFTDYFIPVHRMAAEMAAVAAARGRDPETRTLAARMAVAHTLDALALAVVRRAIGLTADPPPIGDRLDAVALMQLRTAAPPEVDRIFIGQMTAMHGAAMEPAHRGVPVLRHPELRARAPMYAVSSAREIGEMLPIRARLERSAP